MFSRIDDRSSRLLEESNRIGIEFLLTDLDTGLTFLQIAAVTSSPEGRTRNFEKAAEVYRTVARLLPRVVPLPHEQLVIHKKLADLKCRLEEAGFSC